MLLFFAQHVQFCARHDLVVYAAMLPHSLEETLILLSLTPPPDNQVLLLVKKSSLLQHTCKHIVNIPYISIYYLSILLRGKCHEK